MNAHTALPELRLTNRDERLVRAGAPTRWARLGASGGPEDGDEARRRAPLADIHIDLPDEDAPDGADTLVELPLDGDTGAGDTLRMPL